MHKNIKIIVIAVGIALTFAVFAFILRGSTFAILSPAGVLATKERNLMFITVALGMVVLVPVYILIVGIAIRYRETNPKQTKYQPDLAGNRKAEAVWWGIPTIMRIPACRDRLR